ncbi:MAG: hypothetical protein KAI66_12985 [Lentisphaeria bacterium]|nr:hypothetical protein [Lentisphaeria bacterium]
MDGLDCETITARAADSGLRIPLSKTNPRVVRDVPDREHALRTARFFHHEDTSRTQ